MKVSRPAEMRELDRRAVSEFGIAEELLMENAGDAVCTVIMRELGIDGRRFVVFCGTGNNGGDGLVVARKIHSNGGEARVFLLGDGAKMKGAAKQNLDIISKMPVEVSVLKSVGEAKKALAGCDAVVDGIFGTGLDREVGGLHRDVIQLINGSSKTVFSIDIPSGVNGDTGVVMGVAVESNFTVTLGLPKLGNLLYPGFGLGGRLYVSHISFPPSLYDSESIKVEVNDPVELPRRGADSHKGSCGKALFIAGSEGYLGAPYFSAHSFLKAGGGLSYLAAPKSISSFVGKKGRELVLIPQSETDSGSISCESKSGLLEASRKADIVIIGPGLSLNVDTQQLVKELVAEIAAPILIDGDGITAVAAEPGVLQKREGKTIITPHSGEMARLTGLDIDEANRDKVAVLQETAHRFDAYIVFKGAHSLTGYPDGRVYINTSGNPGMATAGSGDVLTGAIAAMYGLGLPLGEAVRTGVFVHGLAGDLAACDNGEDGITAQDILDSLPDAVMHYREDFAELARNFYASVYTV